VQKIGKIVTSPYPYLLLIIVAVMIVMIFVDVMAISGLIVVFAMIMVCTVVLGNHWRSRVVWTDEKMTDTAKIVNHNSNSNRAGEEDDKDATEHSPIIELSLDERERHLEDFFEDMFGVRLSFCVCLCMPVCISLCPSEHTLTPCTTTTTTSHSL
jgi:hypothetical protein